MRAVRTRSFQYQTVRRRLALVVGGRGTIRARACAARRQCAQLRPVPNMKLGHVAVVTRVISAREIEVDQANWTSPGAITRAVPVLDVSPDNDWTSVRAGLPWRDHFGSVYTTNGFIYGRPVELGPQIIDVAQALRAIQNHEQGNYPS